VREIISNQIQFIYGKYGAVDCLTLIELLSIEFGINYQFDDICNNELISPENIDIALIHRNIS
jgi:hypothetical protein